MFDILGYDEGLFSRDESDSEEKGIVLNEDDLLYLPRAYAYSKYSYATKTVKKKGKDCKVTVFSKNDSKIYSTTSVLMQKHFADKFNILKIKKSAEDRLERFFEENNLVPSSVMSEKEIKRIKTFRAIKIDELMKKDIIKAISNHNEITIPFDSFVKMLKIKNVYKEGRVNLRELNNVIDRSQKDSFVEVRNDYLKHEEGVLKREFTISKIPLIPKITITIDQDIEGIDGEIQTFEDLIRSKKRNKDKYIKSVKITFDQEAIVAGAFPWKGFAVTSLSTRHAHSSPYTSRLDDLIRNLEKVQHLKNFNRFKPEEIQQMFGVNYSNFNNFKQSVMNPSLEEVNNQGVFEVEMKEKRVGDSKKGKLLYVYFVIKRKSMLIAKRSKDAETLAHFIASRRFFHHEYYLEAVEGMDFDEYRDGLSEYIKELVKKNKSLDVKYHTGEPNDRTLAQWAELFLENDEYVMKLKEYMGVDEKWFNDRSLVYDNLKMTATTTENSFFKPISSMEFGLITAKDMVEYYLDTKRDMNV